MKQEDNMKGRNMDNKFPDWNPQYGTIHKCKSEDFRTRYKAMRNSSNSFIKRDDVRRFILKKYDYRCYLCGCKDNLQVDHVVSVYAYARERIEPLKTLNSEENLAAICAKCNASKKVERE